MDKRRSFLFAFSFLLTMLPLQVSAAEAGITKDSTMVVRDMAEAEEQAKGQFASVIKEDGTEYELADIEYSVVDTRYLDKKEKVMELKEKPEASMKENGEEYSLKSSEKSERLLEKAAEQTVTAYDDYDHAVTPEDVPETKTVTSVNEFTGAEEEVVCTFTDIAEAGTTTVDNQMTVSFTNYDASYYEWNGNYIPRNDETPPLAGYEDTLLAYVGAAPGTVVTGYYWAGDPYTVDGIVYREAVVNLQQQIQLYRANYTGKIVKPEKKETVYKAVYEAPDKDGRKELTVKAVATYTEVEKSYVPYIIAAGIGLAVLAGLIAAVLIILSRNKKRQK